MKTFFDYCYYRISKAYRFWDEKDYCLYGSLVVFAALCGIFLSMMVFAFSLFDKKLNTTIIGSVCISFAVISIFFINKKKYKQLEQKYKNEKYSKLKGWLVFLYVIGSVALYFISMALCGYWVDVKS